jgi:arylformamidase
MRDQRGYAGSQKSIGGFFMLDETTFAPTVFRHYNQHELDAAYDQNAWCTDRLGAWRRRAEWSADVDRRLGGALRVSYGPRDVEKLSLYNPGLSNCPILILLHGGAWQRGTAEDHAFAAEVMTKAGVMYIAPDFANVQDVGGDLGVLVEQVREAIVWVFKNARAFGGDPRRIFLTGHSSGADLASVALLTDWQVRGVPDDVIRSALLVSGLYDLEGARLSARSRYVSLTDETEQAYSAARFVDRIPCSLTIAYATSDSPEFQRMGQEFAASLKRQGKLAKLIVGGDHDHFSLLETLGRPDGLLANACLKMVGAY